MTAYRNRLNAGQYIPQSPSTSPTLYEPSVAITPAAVPKTKPKTKGKRKK